MRRGTRLGVKKASTPEVPLGQGTGRARRHHLPPLAEPDTWPLPVIVRQKRDAGRGERLGDLAEGFGPSARPIVPRRFEPARVNGRRVSRSLDRLSASRSSSPNSAAMPILSCCT
jgi:hypothetical protein